MSSKQLSLFHVQSVFTTAGAEGKVSTKDLYSEVARTAGIPEDELNKKVPVGRAGAKHSTLKRQIRWYQQTLKAAGIIRPVDGEKGMWELADKTESGLNPAAPGVQLVAYSTRLGLAIFGDCKDVFSFIDEPIHLCVTSPPYPLKRARNYGNVPEKEWVDFVCGALEPIVSHLVPGGSVVLNISNDIFMHKSPARSLYAERMVIALNDRLGLCLMDRWPWINLSKPPGPTYWSCVNRQQLCSGWEPIYWFSNDPARVRSDNRRVLQPHTEKHQQLVAGGGESRTVQYGDGAYRLREGSFSAPTAGKIPKNVIMRGTRCADTLLSNRLAKDMDLPRHSAMYPTSIPEFAIRFLTEPGDLVVDPFSGSNKTGIAAENTGRRWVATERILQYIKLQAALFNKKFIDVDIGYEQFI